MIHKTLQSLLIIFLILPALGFGQTVHQATAGIGQISAAITGASAGDTLELISDGGVYTETVALVVDKDLTIRAAAGLAAKPVIVTDDTLASILLGSSLTLDGIKLDGSLGAKVTEIGILLQSGNMGYTLKLNNCGFFDFAGVGTKGTAVFADGEVVGATQAEMVEIINCMFYRIKGNIIDFSYPDASVSEHGSVKDFYCANSTFQGVSDDPAIYIARNVSGSSSVGNGGLEPLFYVDHCTFINIGSKAIYPKYIDGAVVSNSISAYNEEVAIRIYGANSSITNFLWFSCPDSINYYNSSSGSITPTGTNVINEDPLFADVNFSTSGDFTLSATSPAIGQAAGNKTLGDPRWWPGASGIEISSTENIPAKFQLHQNYPNPFNPSTTIGFDLIKTGHVTLTVYSILGQKITTLVDQQMEAGSHTAKWNTEEIAAGGVYFYKLATNDNQQIRKMIFLK